MRKITIFLIGIFIGIAITNAMLGIAPFALLSCTFLLGFLSFGLTYLICALDTG